MSDVATVLASLPRIAAVLRSRAPLGPGGRQVTRHQAAVLALLDPDDPVMVGELAEHMGVTASTMSLNLARLESAGLVRKERDPDDRRVMNVRLTVEGLEARDHGSSLDPARVDAMLAVLRPEDRTRALQGLRLLAEAAEEWRRRRAEQIAAQL